jgi:hypothetical protein
VSRVLHPWNYKQSSVNQAHWTERYKGSTRRGHDAGSAASRVHAAVGQICSGARSTSQRVHAVNHSPALSCTRPRHLIVPRGAILIVPLFSHGVARRGGTSTPASHLRLLGARIILKVKE